MWRGNVSIRSSQLEVDEDDVAMEVAANSVLPLLLMLLLQQSGFKTPSYKSSFDPVPKCLCWAMLSNSIVLMLSMASVGSFNLDSFVATPRDGSVDLAICIIQSF